MARFSTKFRNMGYILNQTLWTWIILGPSLHFEASGRHSVTLAVITDWKFIDDCVQIHNRARSAVRPPASDMLYMVGLSRRIHWWWWKNGMHATLRILTIIQNLRTKTNDDIIPMFWRAITLSGQIVCKVYMRGLRVVLLLIYYVIPILLSLFL